MRRILAFALLAAAHNVVWATTLPVYQEYRQWLVACANDGACTAKGFDDDGGTSEIVLLQAPGGEGETTLTLTFTADALPELAQLRLGGQRLPPADWVLQPGEASQPFHTLQSQRPDAARAWLRWAARQPALSLQDEQGHELATFAVEGFAAALLRIDEVQGRLNTRVALLRVGSQAATLVSPPRPVPWVQAAKPGSPAVGTDEQARLLRVVNQVEPDCSDAAQASTPEGEVSALNPREAIVLLQCGLGAYNTSYVVYRVQRQGKPAPQRVNLPGLGKRFQGGYWVMNASYDSQTQRLDQYGKARGLADCGSSSGWVFDGRQFVLYHYSFQGRCGGNTAFEWPILWYRSTH